MLLANGFTLWLSGRPDPANMEFALELQNRLVQRGLRAELLTDPGDREFERDATQTAAKLVAIAERQSRHGVISLLIEEDLPAAARRRLQAQFGQVFTVLIQRPLPSSPREDGMFEAPLASELVFRSDLEPLPAAVTRILGELETRGLIPRAESDLQRDEELLLRRLGDLGYL